MFFWITVALTIFWLFEMVSSSFLFGVYILMAIAIIATMTKPVDRHGHM